MNAGSRSSCGMTSLHSSLMKSPTSLKRRAGVSLFGGGKASGGPVKPGYFYEVNEQGREFIAPTAPMQVLNKTQVAGATSTSVVNHYNTINLPPVRETGGYYPRRSQRELSDTLLNVLRRQ
jgi:hypothetical protein